MKAKNARLGIEVQVKRGTHPTLDGDVGYIYSAIAGIHDVQVNVDGRIFGFNFNELRLVK